MTTSTPDLADQLQNPRGRGSRLDRAFSGTALVSGLLVLAILAAIAIVTTQNAWPAFSQFGLSYFFGTTWDPTHDQYGILPLVYGSVVVSAIALLLGVPMSVGIALFITEVAPRRVRSVMITVMDLMAAVPSVVFGLWALIVLRSFVDPKYQAIHDAVANIPVLRTVFGQPSTLNLMTAGLILALMITPIATSVTREVFATVPRNDKEGALALGATRWEMIKGVVLPHSSGGIVGAVMLGLGRALGETIAVVLVIGASPRFTANLFGAAEAMPAKIARDLNEATGVYRAALIGLGVVLFTLTMLINVSARRLTAVVDRRLRGAA